LGFKAPFNEGLELNDTVGLGDMTIIGYARVSTTDQDLSIQETAHRQGARHRPGICL